MSCGTLGDDGVRMGLSLSIWEHSGMLVKGFRIRTMRWTLILTLAAALSLICVADSSAIGAAQQLVYDYDCSMSVGSSGLAALYDALGDLSEAVVPSIADPHGSPIAKPIGAGYRALLLSADGYVPAYLTRVTQHEYFGHGARYREFGYVDSDYCINLPPPLGEGGGWARRGHIEPPHRRLSLDEELAIQIAGTEATNLLGSELALSMLSSGRLSARDGLLYLQAAGGLPGYIAITESESGATAPSGDIAQYIRNLNLAASLEGSVGSALTLDDLKRQSMIALLNPLVYASAWTIGHGYLWSGRRDAVLPAVRVLGVRYLPIARLALTPFGSQYCLENLLSWHHRVLRVTVLIGDPTFHRFWGLDLRTMNLWVSKKVILDLDLRLWHQPALVLGGSNVRANRPGLGGSGILRFRFPLGRELRSAQMALHLGYKTDGFTAGETLASDLILRVGFAF
ncbi:MAG: hypothetical protein GF330_13870 [Candidatus Eisenbacteria bacterium]|nr:hypothetical protein [Candidatus Eisenbacteria bacterium]